MRSSAWTWLFSSIDSTMARAGGQRYSPTMSRTFSTNCGSAGQLEGVEAVRLQPERLPDSPDRGLRQPGDIGESARRPLRRLGRRAFKRAGHHVDDLIVGRFTRRAWPRLVGQPRQAPHATPFAPLADAVGRRRHSLSHGAIRRAIRTREHDACAQRPVLGRLGPARPLLQRAAFVLSHQHRLVVAFVGMGAAYPHRQRRTKLFQGRDTSPALR